MITTRSLARPLLAAIFVSGGVDTLRHPEPRVKVAATVIPDMAERVGLPADADLLVRVNAAVQVTAGILLAIGKLPRLAALALIASTIPTTYAGHRFWELDDKQARGQQRVQFLKNLGLIGGLALAAVDTEGAPSLPWRMHRRAEQAAHTITNVRDGVTSGLGRAVTVGVGKAIATGLTEAVTSDNNGSRSTRARALHPIRTTRGRLAG